MDITFEIIVLLLKKIIINSNQWLLQNYNLYMH